MASPRLIAKGAEHREQIVGFIRAYRDEHGYSPTLQEIAEALGFASLNAVTQHLKTLEAEGRLRTTPRVSRSIVLLSA